MQEQINGQPRGLPHQPRPTLWEGGWCVRRVKCHARLDGELQARHGGAYDNTVTRQGDEEDSECQASLSRCLNPNSRGQRQGIYSTSPRSCVCPPKGGRGKLTLQTCPLTTHATRYTCTPTYTLHTLTTAKQMGKKKAKKSKFEQPVFLFHVITMDWLYCGDPPNGKVRGNELFGYTTTSRKYFRNCHGANSLKVHTFLRLLYFFMKTKHQSWLFSLLILSLMERELNTAFTKLWVTFKFFYSHLFISVLSSSCWHL